MEVDQVIKPQDISEEAVLAAVVEATEDAIIGKTLDGIVLSWNRAAERMYGYSAEEMKGKSLLAIVPPERAIELRLILEQIARGKRVVRLETVRIRKDGTPVPVSLSVTPIRDRSGAIIGAATVARDLTSTTRAAKLVQAARKFSSDILENAPIFFVAIDAQGKTLAMNRHMLDTLGYKIGEVIGKNYLASFVPPESREELAGIFSTLSTRHEQTVNENYVVSKDGARYLVEWRGLPVFDIEGRFQYFYGIGTDITEKRRKEIELQNTRDALELRVRERTAELVKANENLRAEIAHRIEVERQLRESEHLYHVLVEEVPDVIFVLDRHGRFTFLNTQAEKFFEWSLQYLLGSELKTYVVPEDREKIQELFTLKSDAIWDEEIGLIDANKRMKFSRIRCRVLREDENGPLELEGVLRDITRRKTLERELKASRNELLEKIRIIDDLYAHIVELGKARAIADHTAEVAHELRQPLAIIGGFARRLARKLQSAGNQDLQGCTYPAEIISSEIQRLEKILEGLIAYNKLDSIELENSDPNKIIREVLLVFDPMMKKKNLKIVDHLGEELGSIPLDPGGFEQVVRNLLSNAIDASPPGGVLEVETTFSIPGDKAHEIGRLESDCYFQLKIRNSGPRIQREDIQRIFSPFFTTKNYGTGIGLTVSKKIVEAHKGSISVQSDEAGTVFTVWLPVLENEDIDEHDSQVTRRARLCGLRA